MRVAVLGCGPAGLVAAHSARVAGADVTVFSRRRKSELFGSQYLHEPIPGVPDIPESTVHYSIRGTLGEYLDKIYGPNRLQNNITDEIDGPMPAWDIRATYDWLWNQWWPVTIDVDLSAHTLSMVVNGFDAVVSSIPAPWLCLRGAEHRFAASYIWAAGDAPARGILLPDEYRADPQQIVRSGEPEQPWTRISNTYGHVTVEWPDGLKPWPTASRVAKPLWTDCTCWPTLHRVGRYGKWHKDGLVHEVYTEVQQITTQQMESAR